MLGKVLAHELGGLVGDVEVHALLAGLLHLRVDGAGHDVARGQRGERMVFVHERLAFRPFLSTPPSPRTASVMRNDRASGWKRHVGWNWTNSMFAIVAPGAPGHRHAVARGDVGVGRVEVDLAAAAGGEDHAQRAEGFHLAAVLVEHVSAQAAVFRGETELGARDEVHGHVAREQDDVGVLGHRVEQGALDLAAGGVLRVEHAAAGVASLAREVEFVGAVAVDGLAFVEVDAQMDQLADARGSVADDGAHGGAVAQSRARLERVLDMQFKGILVAPDAGHTALRPGGVGVGGEHVW